MGGDAKAIAFGKVLSLNLDSLDQITCTTPYHRQSRTKRLSYVPNTMGFLFILLNIFSVVNSC